MIDAESTKGVWLKPIRPKPIHKASAWREDGAVSALCYKTPRAIALSRATWTFVNECVTCRRCLKLMEVA